MFSPHNKPFITKCIVSFSHNRLPSRIQADRSAIAKAQREMAAGKKGISHLILRAADDEIDQLKFLFLIHGIPLMCYALENLLQSSLQEIVVVGSPEVEQVLEKHLDAVGTRGKRVFFVREEPHNLSLVNTLALGRSKLELDPNELVLFQPGDLPFLYDLEKVLQDKDIEHFNLILWLNSRQAMFPRCEEDPDSEFVQRNYHYRGIVERKNELHDIKEPNVYPLNLSAVAPNIIEQLHQTRKDGQILHAGIKAALQLPSRLIRILPVVLHHLLHFRSDLKKYRKRDRYKFGMHESNFNRGACILLDTPCTSKMHADPAFVSDVDALEDWEDFESLTHLAEKRHGPDGLTQIHPTGERLLAIREQAMPKLRSRLPMYGDFPSYLNRIYRSLQMPYVPFDAQGRYIVPHADHRKVANAYQWYLRQCAAVKGGGALKPS